MVEFIGSFITGAVLPLNGFHITHYHSACGFVIGSACVCCVAVSCDTVSMVVEADVIVEELKCLYSLTVVSL